MIMNDTLRNKLIYYWDLLKGRPEHFDEQLNMLCIHRQLDDSQPIDIETYTYYKRQIGVLFHGVKHDGSEVIITNNNRLIIVRDGYYDVYLSHGYSPHIDPSYILAKDMKEIQQKHGIQYSPLAISWYAYPLFSIIKDFKKVGDYRINSFAHIVASFMDFEDAIVFLYSTGLEPETLSSGVSCAMKSNRIFAAKIRDNNIIWMKTKLPTRSLGKKWLLMYDTEKTYAIPRQCPIDFIDHAYRKNYIDTWVSRGIKYLGLKTEPRANASTLPHIPDDCHIIEGSMRDGYHCLVNRYLYIWNGACHVQFTLPL